jgi:hypothetical protein
MASFALENSNTNCAVDLMAPSPLASMRKKTGKAKILTGLLGLAIFVWNGPRGLDSDLNYRVLLGNLGNCTLFAK